MLPAAVPILPILCMVVSRAFGQSLDPIDNLIPTYGADLVPGYSEPVPVMSGIDMLRMAVPGTPGEDYPIFAAVPDTAFDCQGRTEGGYYADTEADCQPFHICTANGQGGLSKYSFLCPNGTLFNQEFFVCEYWFNVDCSKSESFYNLNDNIGDTEAAGSASSPVGGYASPAGQSLPAAPEEDFFASSPGSSFQPAVDSYGSPSAAVAPAASYTPAASSPTNYEEPSADTAYASPELPTYGGQGGRTGRQRGEGRRPAARPASRTPTAGSRPSAQSRPAKSRPVQSVRQPKAQQNNARPAGRGQAERNGRNQGKRPQGNRNNQGGRAQGARPQGGRGRPQQGARNPGRGGRQNSGPTPLTGYGAPPPPAAAPSDNYPAANAPADNYGAATATAAPSSSYAPAAPSDSYGAAPVPAAPSNSYTPAAPSDSYTPAAPSDSYGAAPAPAAPSDSYGAAPVPDESYDLVSANGVEYDYEEEPLPTYNRGPSSSGSSYVSEGSAYTAPVSGSAAPTRGSNSYTGPSSGSGSFSAPVAPSSIRAEEDDDPLPTYNRNANSGSGSSYSAPQSNGLYGAPADDSYGAPSSSSYGAPSAAPAASSNIYEDEPLPTYNRGASNSGSSSYGSPSAPLAPSRTPASSSNSYGAPSADTAASSNSYEEEPLPTYNRGASNSGSSSYVSPSAPSRTPSSSSNYNAPSSSSNSYGAPPASSDSYGAPAAEPTFLPTPGPVTGGYSDPSADLLPEYFKSEIKLGLSSADDVPRIEPFLADYGNPSSPAADVYTPAASEPDLSYGVPAAPAISLANYNIQEISDKGYPNSGPSSYGR